MTARDWQDSDYVRIYQSIRDDPKFNTVRDDDRAFAAWVRLLMDADLAYPVRASIPASLSRYAKKVLSDAGLVVFAGSTFAIPALKVEREARGDRHGNGTVGDFYGHGSGRRRYPSDRSPKPDSDTTPTSEPDRSLAGARAHSASVSDSESSTTEELPPARAREAEALPLMRVIDYAEHRTGRAWAYSNGSKVLATVEADLRDFGVDVVLEAMAAVDGKPDNGSLVFGASRRLHPISSPAPVSKADREAAEARAAIDAAKGPAR